MVALIAGTITSGKKASAVYDYAAGGYRQVSGSVASERVNLYDHKDSCHLSGSGRDHSYALYHFGQGSHINLKVDPDRKSFSGYDYATGSHFTGNVSGSSVSLYDYSEGQYFNYVI